MEDTFRSYAPPQNHICASIGRGFQAWPSKSKPGQANPNKIAWISLVLFVRIGTYQWVTAIPNKNSLLALRLVARRAFVFGPRRRHRAASDFRKRGVEKL
jgi:hypothetical protein